MLYTISHLAFYLFYCWNIIQKETLVFQQRQQWYGCHLLKDDKIENPLSYKTQFDWINKVFAEANLASLKKTHTGQAQEAEIAKLAGIRERQIRRAG